MIHDRRAERARKKSFSDPKSSQNPKFPCENACSGARSAPAKFTVLDLSKHTEAEPFSGNAMIRRAERAGKNRVLIYPEMERTMNLLGNA